MEDVVAIEVLWCLMYRCTLPRRLAPVIHKVWTITSNVPVMCLIWFYGFTTGRATTIPWTYIMPPSFEWPRCFGRLCGVLYDEWIPKASGTQVCVCVCVCVKLDRFDSWPQYVQGMHSIASTLRWLFIVEVFAIYEVRVMHCYFSILRKVLQHAIEKKRVFYIIIIVKIHDKHCLRCIMCILCHIINWCDTGEMSPITNVILLYWRCLEWMFAILI